MIEETKIENKYTQSLSLSSNIQPFRDYIETKLQ